ncbi:hypothetical protein J6Z48_01510, partial [bacterium]|nr:hypothetical protein [bacterium]
MKKIPGQAVVIAMILLIVVSIIGLSLAYRMRKDNEGTLDKTTSAEALEISNSVVNVISLVDTNLLYKNVEQEANKTQDSDGNSVYTKRISGVDEIKSFLQNEVGISFSDGKNITELAAFENLFSNCGNGEGGTASDVYMNLTTTPQSIIEIPDSVTIGYSVQGQTVKDGCSLNLSFDPVLSSSIGVVVQKVYSRLYSNGLYEYKNYDLNDTKEFCVYKNGTSCDTTKYIGSAWGNLEANTVLNFYTDGRVGIPLREEDLSVDGAPTGYMLDEIRITPVGGNVYLSSSLSEPGCAGKLDLVGLKVEVVATCNGTSRGKEVVVPRENNDSYATTFDYVLYNSQGKLELFDSTDANQV